MTASVKDLIRSIRGSKTASEERAILARECAKIRTTLNSDNVTSRKKNIAKLLFINLLGYPTNFGQVECIKLIASSKFSDKRIGYLALNLLLTEDSEVLMLATNSIKIDLNNPNPYVCEMALGSLANIGTNEMLRELQYEIDNLMNSNVSNIKKKATICTVRMLRKAAHRNLTPDTITVDLAQSFMRYVEPLVTDFDNGVKTAGLSLMSVLLEYYTNICNLDYFFNLLLNTMTQLLSSNTENFATQNLPNDRCSTDPFLKVKLLSLIKQVYLKLLYNKPNSVQSNELLETNDFDVRLMEYRERLYKVVSTMIRSIETRSSMNDVILYECVSTIECEFSDERFNELGKQVVDKFMVGFNNNVKYISLGIIKKLHNVEMKFGDSNWTIIVQSFKQRDISIRKKALDVSLKVVNRETLAPIVQYLYEFLLSADDDLKRESMHRIFNCVNLHSDDVGYKLQVFVKIFSIAGNSVQDPILFDFIDLLASSSEVVKAKTTLELLKVLKYNMGQSALVKSSLYSLGEYYQLLSKDDLKSLSSVNRGTIYKHTASNDQLNDSVKKSDEAKQGDGNDLLDLSTPTNSHKTDTLFNSFEKSNEDDLLLDLNSPTDNQVVEPNSVDKDEIFDLYTFDRDYTQSKFDDKVDPVDQDESDEVVVLEGDEDLVVIELVENVSVALIAKNLLSECEFLITCVGKLVYKMPKRLENLRKILKRFKRHPNPELQQRSCEVDIIIQENITSLLTSVSNRLPDLYTQDSVELLAEVEDAKVSEPKTHDSPTSRDLFDEFFNEPVSVSQTQFVSQSPSMTKDSNVDKLTSNIVDNVALVSSREKREDDFQQFDPF